MFLQFPPFALLNVISILLFFVVVCQNRIIDHAVVFLGAVYKIVPFVQGILVVIFLFVACRLVSNRCHQDSAVGREHQSGVLPQIPVSSNQDGIQHRLADQHVPHPFANDHVHYLLVLSVPESVFLQRQFDPLNCALNDRDDVCYAIGLDQFARVVCHVGIFDCVHFLCSGLRGPDGQDPRSGANVHHDFIPKCNFGICHDGGVIGIHAVRVCQHVFLMMKFPVGREIQLEVLCLPCLLFVIIIFFIRAVLQGWNRFFVDLHSSVWIVAGLGRIIIVRAKGCSSLQGGNQTEQHPKTACIQHRRVHHFSTIV
mmetsp:Transcript_11160/g.26818  ORF Transcript_11160/g.26818 Transcript_11160/m.26818 type:complete len:312 (-) Transcript_11160:31-966(-)